MRRLSLVTTAFPANLRAHHVAFKYPGERERQSLSPKKSRAFALLFAFSSEHRGCRTICSKLHCTLSGIELEMVVPVAPIGSAVLTKHNDLSHLKFSPFGTMRTRAKPTPSVA
jgi:hypothetical protein